MSHRRDLLAATVAALLAAASTSGCRPSHLVYVQQVSAGLNVAVGTEGNQKMSFGYDRDVYAIVPSRCSDRNAKAQCDTTDVMSLLSLNSANVGGLRDMKISEFVATGKPATKLADKPNAVNQLRDKIYGAGEH